LVVRLRQTNSSSNQEGHSNGQSQSSSSSSSSSSRSSGEAQARLQGDAMPAARSDEWLVLHLLGPADLANGPEPAGGWSCSSSSISSNYEAAVEQLAQQLGSSCGCFLQGSSALGHAKRSLMAYATGSGKRHLALLKSAGWRVAVVPFHELHVLRKSQQAPAALQNLTGVADAAQHGSTGGCVDSRGGNSLLQYVAAVLREQCGVLPEL
jgi:hypothetical protein